MKSSLLPLRCHCLIILIPIFFCWFLKFIFSPWTFIHKGTKILILVIIMVMMMTRKSYWPGYVNLKTAMVNGMTMVQLYLCTRAAFLVATNWIASASWLLHVSPVVYANQQSSQYCPPEQPSNSVVQRCTWLYRTYPGPIGQPVSGPLARSDDVHTREKSGSLEHIVHYDETTRPFGWLNSQSSVCVSLRLQPSHRVTLSPLKSLLRPAHR